MRLREPRVIESVDGFLNVTISLEATTVELDGFVMTTRTFNGSIPGPTLVISPGDTLNVKFVNLLPNQGLTHHENQLSAPDESNLHWHGLHVSGEEPSDDSMVVIPPAGGTYQYTSVLPTNHHPGTHWLHPHRHGSTTVQVGGGAAAAIIVRDTLSANTIPAFYTNMRSIVLVVQPLLPGAMLIFTRNTKDELFSIEDRELAASEQDKLMLVNGRLQPSMDDVNAGMWIRLRVVYASWNVDRLDLTIPGCRIELIAKDGIYLRQIPRVIQKAPIVPGGRADILVQCPEPSSTYRVFYGDGEVLAVIETTNSSVFLEEDPIALPVHKVNFPEYLDDLRSKFVNPNCSCPTNVGQNGGINGFRFDSNNTVHQYIMEEVIERHLRAVKHPYHQHVHPFQLISGFSDILGNPYYQLGDWHDTVEDEGVIRYFPTDFKSKIMIHCHRLDHEDKGMMGIERVGDACVCGPVKQVQVKRGDSIVLAWTVVAIVTAVMGAALYSSFVYFRRRRTRQSQFSVHETDTRNMYGSISLPNISGG